MITKMMMLVINTFNFKYWKNKEKEKKIHRNLPCTDLHTTDKPISVYLTEKWTLSNDQACVLRQALWKTHEYMYIICGCVGVWVAYLWWGGQCRQTASSTQTAPCPSCTAASWEGSCSPCRSPWTCSDPASAQPVMHSSDTPHGTMTDTLHMMQWHKHHTWHEHYTGHHDEHIIHDTGRDILHITHSICTTNNAQFRHTTW